MHYFPRKFQNSEYFYPKCLKSISNVIKDLSEAKQQLCQNLKLKIMGYLPCPWKIHIQNCFGALSPISKIFAAHFITN